MAQTEYRRLILAAQSRAEAGFMGLVQQALQDADRQIGERLLQTRSTGDQSALKSVRDFVRQDSSVFLRRVDGLFRNYLERAMQTMFVDLRPGLRNLAADELTLIDDEVVNHQIEVGRLAQRMREATEESIGRLNVIIAQLHGQVEARERENPFRPYLLARALYEAVKTSFGDEARARLLFEHLSVAMVEHLPGFYASLRSVFETSGVHGKFVAQRSRHAPGQRYFGAPGADSRSADQFQHQLMPGLKRLFDSFSSVQAGGDTLGGLRGADTQVPSAQELLRRMLSPGRSLLPPGGDRTQIGTSSVPAISPLLPQLDAIQRQAAAAIPDAQAAGGRDALAAVRDRLGLQNATMVERMTVDVVALLFELLLEDQSIPAVLRQQIARLQIPVLKAAIMEPELLHDEGHPARLLLNRIGSSAASADPDSPDGRRLAAEVERLAGSILKGFTNDTGIFEDSLAEFEQFLTDFIRREDRYAAEVIDVVEAAERCSVLLANAMNMLCEVLPPLNVDKRLSDFILRAWPHVLMQAARRDGSSGAAFGAGESLAQRYRALVPELIWSIQDKQSQEDRSALMRMLPGLVKQLRQAFELIQLPDDEAREILDVLVEMHTRILRGTAALRQARQPLSLDELRQRFARVSVSWEQASWTLSEPPRIRDTLVEDMLAERKLKVDLRIERGAGGTGKEDLDFLAQAYLVGTRVRFAGPERQAAQLVWVSTHRSLYLFRQERQGGAEGQLILFGFASLLEALRSESVMPLEHAPAFERAVESLLFGAGRLAQQ